MTSAPLDPVPYTDEQRRQAAEWFVVIHADDDPGAETLQAWLRWMDQAEGNRQAFEAVEHAWHAVPDSVTGSMPTSDELLHDHYDGERSVAAWSQTASGRGRRFVPAAWHWALAATVCLVALGLALVRPHLHPAGHRADVFSTRTGEQMPLTLADGSRIWLGPQSSLAVDFSASTRLVELRTGEAYFTVHKDPSRPFVVRTQSGDITAVGTAFNVQAVTERVTVSVSEGIVAVAPSSAVPKPPGGALRVAHGEQLTFAARQALTSLHIVRSPVPGERSRWRDGVLVYRDEPLRDVVADVARYSGVRLELVGEAVGNLRYSGIVYEGAVEEWTAALPESFPVKVISQGDREIISAR